MTEDKQKIESMSFEKALAELEKAINLLETGEADLEKTIAIYERGAKLRAHCEARLKKAEERIESIISNSEGEAIGSKPISFE